MQQDVNCILQEMRGWRNAAICDYVTLMLLISRQLFIR